MAGAAGTLFSLLVIFLISAAPLTAATFVGRRMGYGGLALIAPWAGAIGLGLLIGLGLASLDGVAANRANPSAVIATATVWTAGMLLSGYITTVVYLVVLAVRRLPSRPTDAAAVF